MGPIVRLVPNTSPPWVWRAAIMVSQRAKLVSGNRPAFRRVMWRWSLWKATVARSLRLVGRVGEVLGLDLGDIQVWVVEKSFWWVR